jgi:hypothetical protein
MSSVSLVCCYASPKPQDGGARLVGCLRLFIQYIYWNPLHNGQSSLKARASRSKDIKNNFQEIAYEEVDSVSVAQDCYKPWSFLEILIISPFIYQLSCTTFRN